MRLPLALLALSSALTLTCHAELIVYRETERAVVTVAGRQATVPVSTYIVHDTTSGTFSGIGLIRMGANKYYAITNEVTTHRVTHGIAGPLGNYTVISRVEDADGDPDLVMSAYYARGRTTELDLGNATTASFPRVLKAITRSVRRSSGHLASYEAASTVVFQATETKTANLAGETAAAVIERLRARFVAQGYVPAP